MNSSSLTTSVAADVRRRLAGDTSGHDWFHIERVHTMALRIAVEEQADMMIVELAALLHDIADYKFTGDEESGPRVAREILESLKADPAIIDHVCEIIATLSFKGAGVPSPMSTLEGKVVQDADRLDALGAIGIARAFAYGGHADKLLHDPGQSPTLHADKQAYMHSKGTTINHFYEKLLLLKDRMNTQAGKRLAEHRHRVLEEFLQEFLAEWEGTR